MIKKDVIIVGGGPAGSACARRLKQNNVDCLILEKQSFPRFKPCAGWLTPEIFNDLDLKVGDYPFGLTEFNSFKISIKKIRFTLPTRQYAIRRWEFDNWLLNISGVPNDHHEVRTIYKKDGGYCIDDQYWCRSIIGAGGSYCPVRRQFFRDYHSGSDKRLIVAMEEEFKFNYNDDACQLWFMADHLPGYAWYVPKVDGYVNVGIGAVAHKLKENNDSLKKHWEKLIKSLAQKSIIETHDYHPRGHSYYLINKDQTVNKEGAFLVGDSAGLASRDMGEGIRPAVMSGIMAADAIVNNTKYDISSIPVYSFPSILGFRK